MLSSPARSLYLRYGLALQGANFVYVSFDIRIENEPFSEYLSITSALRHLTVISWVHVLARSQLTYWIIIALFRLLSYEVPETGRDRNQPRTDIRSQAYGVPSSINFELVRFFFISQGLILFLSFCLCLSPYGKTMKRWNWSWPERPVHLSFAHGPVECMMSVSCRNDFFLSR